MCLETVQSRRMFGSKLFLKTNETNTGLSATSGVVRDEMGKWILGYSWFLGKSSVFVAEL
ncbi:hypothetical protein Gorai_023173 [Gossypium raimondii]|uniref:RNase H type-1 domain-containing protein n=1 Tax=Gossypium raimondii TaxID=29730 RepID=A0A7J8NVN9_GOSRA|nr:hypothetical protein [Gossypium raimondii]